MENNSAGATPEEAAQALAALSADDRALATRVITPRWYHPIYALLVAIMTIGIAFPIWNAPVLIACIAGQAGLANTYRRRYGVDIASATGPRTRGLVIALVCVVVVCMSASALIGFSSVPIWLIAIPVAVNALSSFFLGRAYDAALRRELAGE